eukprot:CAMPEP_0174923996 /NCGR_PEP_ID=MMETSP1355-20121228/6954_1 /TAXON_ID=464990 /ORGANISM="Hemiselmis tepida, Strain CCMP443" /LENGTH=63 /DNA_ID=CAMNT_0016169737 /DNA_START=501 /DNA_END=692 /DNA_ORIENTATION=-
MIAASAERRRAAIDMGADLLPKLPCWDLPLLGDELPLMRAPEKLMVRSDAGLRTVTRFQRAIR